MTTSVIGYRVFTCDVCGAVYRFPRTRTVHPGYSWPPVTYGVVHDEETDTAMRQHAVTHGGALDRQLAYLGPTTWTTHTEELTAEPTDAT